MNEESRTFALEQLKRIVSPAPSRRDLAWQELQNGVDPAYVAYKYQFPVETMLAAKQTLVERQKKRD